MKPAIAALPAPPDVSARGGFDLTALWALFVLTLRQHLRGRRLLVLALLFLMPSVLVALVRLAEHPPDPEHLEFGFLFNLMPHALATLTALLYAGGMIQDEVEEQTLTYLLLRPIPRWALYVTKLAATVLVTSALTGVFTTVTYVVIYWNEPELWSEVLPERAPRTAALYALAQVGYCSFFGVLTLLTRRSLIGGLAYIIAFEGLLASFQSVLRLLTVMFYFRVLAARWVLGSRGARQWGLELADVPSAGECVARLLAVSAVLVFFGALTVQRREFRMKTPEGS